MGHLRVDSGYHFNDYYDAILKELGYSRNEIVKMKNKKKQRLVEEGKKKAQAKSGEKAPKIFQQNGTPNLDEVRAAIGEGEIRRSKREAASQSEPR